MKETNFQKSVSQSIFSLQNFHEIINSWKFILNNQFHFILMKLSAGLIYNILKHANQCLIRVFHKKHKTCSHSYLTFSLLSQEILGSMPEFALYLAAVLVVGTQQNTTGLHILQQVVIMNPSYITLTRTTRLRFLVARIFLKVQT